MTTTHSSVPLSDPLSAAGGAANPLAAGTAALSAGAEAGFVDEEIESVEAEGHAVAAANDASLTATLVTSLVESASARVTGGGKGQGGRKRGRSPGGKTSDSHSEVSAETAGSAEGAPSGGRVTRSRSGARPARSYMDELEVDSDADTGEEERDLDEEGREVKRPRGGGGGGRGRMRRYHSPGGSAGGGSSAAGVRPRGVGAMRAPSAPPSVPNPLAGLRGRSDSTGSQILTRSRSSNSLAVEDPLDSVGSSAAPSTTTMVQIQQPTRAIQQPAAVTSTSLHPPAAPVSSSLNDPPAPPRRPSFATARPKSESMGEFADVAASMGCRDFGQDGLDAHREARGGVSDQGGGDDHIVVGGDGGRGRIFSIDLDRECLLKGDETFCWVCIAHSSLFQN